MATSQTAKAAWKTDADTYPGMTFDDYRASLIHETAKIRDFLTETRGEHFILSAPKGFGKTLLLIAKRKQMDELGGYHIPKTDVDGEEARQAILGSSSGSEIVDRPGGVLPVVGRSLVDQLKADFFFWTNVWRVCITIGALKLEARSSKSPQNFSELPCDIWIKNILADREVNLSPASIFSTLMEENASTRQKVIQTGGILNRYFRELRSPIAFFIDNVDEYFQPLLEDRRIDAVGPKDANYYRSKSNDIWTVAQLGLVGAAYGIHKENSHIKVYCTIRREAFIRLHEFATQNSNQIAGCTVEIEYDHDDLKEIFQKNIQLMPHSKLFAAEGNDPMQVFFGPAQKQMKHRFVDQAESGFDFVLRHTFYRPRDLMLIGDKIAEVDISRRTGTRIKELVDEASTKIVMGLMDEMKPFFFLPDMKALSSLITRNVMTKDELDVITNEYRQRFRLEDEHEYGDDAKYMRPFHALYQVGMLGWISVDNDRDLRLRQRFVKPRDVTFQNHADLPPTEKYYLIHPALDHFISGVAGGVYFRNFHRTNVIGNDAPWTDPATSLFVIKGDIVSFSKIMESEFYEAISEKLHEWAESACKELDFFEVSGGDSIVLIDRSAERIFRSAAELLSRARAYKERKLSFRFGGAAGPISFRERKRRVGGNWTTHVFPLGLALRSSARLEPHAPEGFLLIDEVFVQANRINEGHLDVVEVAAGEIQGIEHDPVRMIFRIQKKEGDPICETKLYKVALPDGFREGKLWP